MVSVEAVVDTGATRLYLKPSVIQKLGLARVDAVRSQTTNGEVVRFKYEPVQVELMGPKETCDVIEVPEPVPNRLGQLPLEARDLVVDSKGRKLIPNPAHGGEQMIEEVLDLPWRGRRQLPLGSRRRTADFPLSVAAGARLALLRNGCPIPMDTRLGRAADYSAAVVGGQHGGSPDV